MITIKRYAVLPRQYSFGFTVREAIKRHDGTINVPLPYKVSDIVTLFKRKCAARRYARSLTKSALDRLTSVSYLLVDRRKRASDTVANNNDSE